MPGPAVRPPRIVIPVFNAFEPLVQCLAALDRTAPDAEVLLVEDASTDGRVWPWVEQWVAANAQRRALRHAANLGFVASANEGLALGTGDVVLLNSDTLPATGWLEALARCLQSDPDIATATPWTNNGEIASFPDFCVRNPVPTDVAALDELAAAAQASKLPGYADLPTAVGFCMAISARAIQEVGLFDVEAFGHGYGEENDFSLRASALGLRNVLCDDAYVAHVGGQSFGPLGLRPGAESMQRLLVKHPAYAAQVADFIRNDPLSSRRERLADALARARIAQTPLTQQT